MTIVENAPVEAGSVPFLTDEQIDQMSQEELLSYFERLRSRAAARNIPLPTATKSHTSGGGITIEQVLSRAGILARAQSAADQANARVTAVKATYDNVLEMYMRGNNLTELPEATSTQISEHVKTVLENAKSGYEKVSAANKGKPKRKGTLEAQAETVGENTPEAGSETVSEEVTTTEG
jgi:hypothetical protein